MMTQRGTGHGGAPVVSFEGVSKSYGHVKAVDGLSLDLRAGETVAFHQGHLYINGRLMDEPYVKLQGDWEHEPEQVGLDEYYVVGDNRDMPWEGHVQGKPKRQRIVGKILL